MDTSTQRGDGFAPKCTARRSPFPRAGQVPRSLRLTFDEEATQEELARLARKGRKGLVATMLRQEGAAAKRNRARQVGRMKQGAETLYEMASVHLFVLRALLCGGRCLLHPGSRLYKDRREGCGRHHPVPQPCHERVARHRLADVCGPHPAAQRLTPPRA